MTTNTLNFAAALPLMFPRGSLPIILNTYQPRTAGRMFQVRLDLIYQNGSMGTLQMLANRVTGMHTGYHGTSTARIGEQLSQGKFEDRGAKVYFANLPTASNYALEAAMSDKSQPIVLQIGSKQTPQWNPIRSEGWGFGLGLYAYFTPSNAEVKILKAYQVEPLTAQKN